MRLPTGSTIPASGDREGGIAVAVDFYKPSLSDRIFNIVVFLLATFSLVIVLYPLILVVSSSFSDGNSIVMGKVLLLPVNANLGGYKEIFGYQSVFIGYANAILYMVVGTLLNLTVSILMAYPLSRLDLKGRKFLTLLLIFTMLFNAGLIPNYLLMRDLNLINSRLVMILPKAINAYNIIVMITYFRGNVARELLEATKIDGCSDFRFVTAILIPISKPMIAVMTLFFAVGHWNSYFDAMIYLNSSSKFPLQLVLKEILLQNQITPDMMSTMNLTAEEMAMRMGLSQQLKYALIVVSSVPLMILYPFIQKYFVKGVMIGSIKG